MIEVMKTLCILTTVNNKKSLINAVRELGVVHIKEKKNPNPEKVQLFSELSIIENLLRENPNASTSSSILSKDDFFKLHSCLVETVAKKGQFESEKIKALQKIEELKPWGKFNPQDINYLKESGIPVYLYKIGKKEKEILLKEDNISFISLSEVNKSQAIAVLYSPLDKTFPASLFSVPEKGIDELLKDIDYFNGEIASCEKTINSGAKELSSYAFYKNVVSNEMNFTTLTD
ncbi:MAG: hypothetical protein HUK24_08020, partial [Sphaerochaetaceae bacterium]|nr:hypothetical protein [Sphaerochaetaceae bacterium]